jgi:isoquinoline 1-oxidoreductase beta subunit
VTRGGDQPSWHHWSVAEGELSTAGGMVHHRPSGRSIAYALLAEAAVSVEPPDPARLKMKDPAEFRIIGPPVRGVDTPAIVAGQPLFGIDVTLPGLLHAVLETCPAVGGQLLSANLDQVRDEPGVRHVLTLEGDGEAESLLSSVAILAES